MPIVAVPDPYVINFQRKQEAAMGVHVARLHTDYCLVFGCAFAMTVDTETLQEILQLSEARWYAPSFSLSDQKEFFDGWLSRLPLMPVEPTDPEEGRDILQFVARGLPPPPIPPLPPTHLPHTHQSSADSVFYRWESVPTSRKINQASGQILPGTYAAPSSELMFNPTGLSAVARYALPSVMPAQWRWELKPPAGTTFRCGASVPLNGQSGGGVEVIFPTLFSNQGPIANPVVLPVL